MDRRWTLRLVGGALAALTLWVSTGLPESRAQETTALSGVLGNGSAEADFSPESVPVTLYVLEGVVEMENRTITPGPEGAFEFREVSTVTGRTYFLTAEYQGAVYSISLRAEELAQPVALTVYEATTSADFLSVSEHTIIVTGADPDQRVVEVLERSTLVNSGDRTLVPDLAQEGGMPQFLRFGLPPGFHNLDVRSDLVGGDVLEVDRGFAITTPVAPSGEEGHHFEFVYRVPYTGTTLGISRTLRFGAGTLRVVVPADMALATSPQLTDLGSTTVNERELQLLEGVDLAPGEHLELYLEGLPQPSLLSRLGRSAGHWYLAAGVPGLLGVALATVLVLALLRRKQEPTAVPGGPLPDRQAILQQLVDLERRYAETRIGEGGVGEGTMRRGRYGRERRRLKQQLLRLDLQRRLDQG